MKKFVYILSFLVVICLLFVIYITREGEMFTPVGEGMVSLDIGDFEALPLPDYALNMINSDYRSYLVEVEPGIKVHVLDVGQGLPVFLMHGNPTSGFLYRKVVENLPLDRVRVIMPTSVGLGFSSKVPASQHTLDNHIRWINETLNQLQISEVIYAGQDWGGPIGMGALALSPDVLKGAVILNTGFNAPSLNTDISPAHALVKTPVVGELILEVVFSIFERLGGVQGDPSSWSEDVVEIYGRPVYESGNAKAPLALMRMVTDGPDHPSTPALKMIENYVNELDIPVEIVWGMKDPILAKTLPIMKDNFPEAPVTETSAGHFLQEEVPTEIAEALVRVINKVTNK